MLLIWCAVNGIELIDLNINVWYNASINDCIYFL